MEFENLGKHCKICNVKDFLPFRCMYCDSYYCKEHRDKHNCVEANPLSRQKISTQKMYSSKLERKSPLKKRNRMPRYKCSVEGCKTKEKFPVKCFRCNQNFCLKHRFQELHKCL